MLSHLYQNAVLKNPKSIFILLIVFLIRAYFIFRKERNSQTWSNIKKTKVIPKTSDVIFVVTLTFVILFSVNYFFNFVMY